MEKMQKLQMMDKILRELDDLKSSQTSVLKKVTQIETLAAMVKRNLTI